MEGWKRSTQLLAEGLDPLACREELLANAALAAGWLVQYFHSGNQEIWAGLVERDEEFVSALFGLLFGSKKGARHELVLAKASFSAQTFYLINECQYRVLEDPKEIRRYLPVPGDGWVIGEPGN